MASIQKRNKNNFSVVYRYKDSDGKSIQQWESFKTHKEALKRKAEIERQQTTDSFIPPSNETVSMFLCEWVEVYGKRKWNASMYQGEKGLIKNYIDPLIGEKKMQDINPRTVEQFITALQKTTAVSTKTYHARTNTITNNTIEKIIKLLRCAFSYAVKTERINKNPFTDSILPKVVHVKREVWDIDTIKSAIDLCEDTVLRLCIEISVACSCRLAEILGLTWKNVDISNEKIANGDCAIYITQQLQRISTESLNATDQGDILYTFPTVSESCKTRRVFKKPKTESSIRKIWLPTSLAKELQDYRDNQEELKRELGRDYHDYDLVIALPNGEPCENSFIEKHFKSFIKKNDLPYVVFHSLRHSSTSYKLKLNHGDLKATQGDTGHSQTKMITDIYAHIQDEDRRQNAIKFEEAFYGKPAATDTDLLLQKIAESPELLAKLSALLNEQKPAVSKMAKSVSR